MICTFDECMKLHDKCKRGKLAFSEIPHESYEVKYTQKIGDFWRSFSIIICANSKNKSDLLQSDLY